MSEWFAESFIIGGEALGVQRLDAAFLSRNHPQSSVDPCEMNRLSAQMQDSLYFETNRLSTRDSFPQVSQGHDGWHCYGHN